MAGLLSNASLTVNIEKAKMHIIVGLSKVGVGRVSRDCALFNKVQVKNVLFAKVLRTVFFGVFRIINFFLLCSLAWGETYTEVQLILYYIMICFSSILCIFYLL